MLLKTFVLVGVVLSFDDIQTTVQFNFNPAVIGGPAVAVLPSNAIPCKIEVGKKIYVVKDKNTEYATISCEAEK